MANDMQLLRCRSYGWVVFWGMILGLLVVPLAFVPRWGPPLAGVVGGVGAVAIGVIWLAGFIKSCNIQTGFPTMNGNGNGNGNGNNTSMMRY